MKSRSNRPGMHARTISTGLALAIAGLAAGHAGAQDAADDAAPAAGTESGTPATDIPNGERDVGRWPSIPIHPGQSYEGRLAVEDGHVLAHHGGTRFSFGELGNVPVAYFDIELLEGETVSYGVQSSGPTGVVADFHREVTSRKGVASWKYELTMSSGFPSARRCLATVRVRKSGRYRVEIRGGSPEPIEHYKFYVLPDMARFAGVTPLCDEALPAEAKPFLDHPGRAASIQIAREWVGRERVLEAFVPAVHVRDAMPEALDYARGKPAPLRAYYQTLYTDGEHNAVLNFAKLGLAAMEVGEYSEAEWAFDEALARIEAIYGRNKVAEAARSKWIGEGIKDFKGEPYERVMAYYYRGLLYVRAGDYENARAAFMAGEFQDTLAEGEQFQSDFALMNYLAGWASQCAGNPGLAEESFAVAERFNAQLKRPTDQDTLVLADLGQGPVKVRRGNRNRLLSFAEAVDGGRDEQAIVRVGTGKAATSFELSEATDLYFQSTTRGGRRFDRVLDAKAGFRNGMQGATDVSSLLVLSGIPVLQAAGLLAMVASDKAGKNVKPEADVRMWDTLPHHVGLGLVDAGPASRITYEAAGATPAWNVPVMRAHHGRCGIAWSRSRSALATGAGVPGEDADIVGARSKNEEAVALDAAFRAALNARDGAAP